MNSAQFVTSCARSEQRLCRWPLVEAAVAGIARRNLLLVERAGRVVQELK
jgi:hypothetical protein